MDAKTCPITRLANNGRLTGTIWDAAQVDSRCLEYVNLPFLSCPPGDRERQVTRQPHPAHRALDQCRRHRATLVIAKLDRLARNVHFISGLMESGIDIVAVDMPQAVSQQAFLTATALIPFTKCAARDLDVVAARVFSVRV